MKEKEEEKKEKGKISLFPLMYEAHAIVFWFSQYTINFLKIPSNKNHKAWEIRKPQLFYW